MNPELLALCDELDRDDLTEARWREMTARAQAIARAERKFEIVEAFLMEGDSRGWRLPD